MRDYCPNAFLSSDAVWESCVFVGRHGALFQFGVACLRRVRDNLASSAQRDAAEETEAYARFQTSRRAMAEAWTRVDESLTCDWWLFRSSHWSRRGAGTAGLGVWPEESPLLTSPALFAARLAVYSRRVASNEEEETRAQRHLYNDIIGPPFWVPEDMGQARHDQAVREMAFALDRTRDIDALGVLALADALEEAGCTNEEMLDHCRSSEQHHRGCWVIEELTGRASRRLPTDSDPPKKKRHAPLIPMKKSILKPPAQVRPVS
jgi:hypothetical protein